MNVTGVFHGWELVVFAYKTFACSIVLSVHAWSRCGGLNEGRDSILVQWGVKLVLTPLDIPK